MLVVIASEDKYLSANVRQLLQEHGLFSIGTSKLERISKELKLPDRCAIIDMAWETAQEPGILKQLVNIARITDNKVICICPNQEEDLKKLAKFARADHVFIRYDMQGSFREYLRDLAIGEG